MRVNKWRLIGDTKKVEPPSVLTVITSPWKDEGEPKVRKKASIRAIDLKPMIARCAACFPLRVNNNSVLIIWLVMSSKANGPGADGLVPSISDTRVHFDDVSLIKLIHLLIIRSTFWRIHASGGIIIKR